MTEKDHMNEVIEIVRKTSFVKTYTPSTEECLGVAVSHYLEWDSRIFRVFYEALENANFHTEAARIAEIFEKYINEGGL